MRQLIAPFTAALLAFSPLVQAADIQTQLTDFFTQRLTGFSDEVSVSLRNAQNLKLAWFPTFILSCVLYLQLSFLLWIIQTFWEYLMYFGLEFG